jgi:hypothetical protein
MKTRLYLHIGHPKTGTTSIQDYLLKNELLLRARGYLYPLAGRRHAARFAHFRLFPITLYHQDENNTARRELEALRREVARERPAAVMISCEIAFAEQADCLKEAFRDFDVSILYYIRRQDQWIASFYAQRTKYARMAEFRPLRGMALEWIPPYLQTIHRFALAFGKENVHVRPFEKNAWFNGDLIQDFLREIGLDPAGFPPSETPLNESLKPDYLKFALVCNQLPLTRLEAAKLRRAIVALSDAEARAPSVPLLDDETRLRILEHCAEDNARIASEFLGRADGILFREPFKKQPLSWRETEPLSPAVQHAIFDRLPPTVRESLSSLSPEIRNRRPGFGFLPPPCPDNPDAQHRLWALREHARLARLLNAEPAAPTIPPLPETASSLEAFPERLFFERVQADLARIHSAVLGWLAVNRPDLSAPPLPPFFLLAPDCAALARAFLLLPLGPTERLMLMRNLARLSDGAGGGPVRVAADELNQPEPPDPAQPSADRQQALFLQLDPGVRDMLTFFSAAVRDRLPGQAFWPPIPANAALWRRQLLERDAQAIRRAFAALQDHPGSGHASSHPERPSLKRRLLHFLRHVLKVIVP